MAEAGKPNRARLTAAGVRNAAPGRHGDGGGLYLVVDPGGARRWLLRTVVQGRRRDLGLGSAQLVGLAEARERAHAMRRIARAGGDPTADRAREPAPTFAEAARRVHAEQVAATARNAKAAAQWLATLERYAFRLIGERPVGEVAQADVLAVLAPIWLEVPETARRVRQRTRVVLDWARTAGYRDGVNPVEGVERGLPRQRDAVEHFAALPWADVPALWPRLRDVGGMGALALRFAILTAARSGEVRGCDWSEIDVEARLWTVPAARMKAGRPHRVPLSGAALAVLEEAAALAGRRGLVFPGARGGRLSDMSLSAVLRRLGVGVTVHGFRSAFRDWAQESGGWSHAAMERALAHVVREKVVRAYARTDLLEQRRPMMAAWASHCTGE